MAANLVAMASNLVAMAFNLVAMASNLIFPSTYEKHPQLNKLLSEMRFIFVFNCRPLKLLLNYQHGRFLG